MVVNIIKQDKVMIMSSLRNSVQLLGRLGTDAQVKVSQNGVAYCIIRFVTNITYLDKDNKQVTSSQWHTLSVWGNLTKHLEKKGQKGSLWLIQGRLVHSKYTNRHGEEKQSTEVRVDRLLYLSGKGENSPAMTT